VFGRPAGSIGGEDAARGQVVEQLGERVVRAFRPAVEPGLRKGREPFGATTR